MSVRMAPGRMALTRTFGAKASASPTPARRRTARGDPAGRAVPAGAGFGGRDAPAGAGSGKGLDDGSPDPRAPAGDHRHLPGQVEQVVDAAVTHSARSSHGGTV